MRITADKSSARASGSSDHARRSDPQVRSAAPGAQNSPMPHAEPPADLLALQRIIAGPSPVQRACAACEADVQQRGMDEPGELTTAKIHDAAKAGTSGASGSLPHLDAIQSSFGKHDVSGIAAHTDRAAADGARAMNATAFTTGNHIAFASAPSLHTAAHEAAHAIQQRGGVQLAGGVGAVGDRYERHADAVADAVVAGRSAEALLDKHS
jgi:hypothetical protein